VTTDQLAANAVAPDLRRAAAAQGTLAFEYMLRPDNLMVRPLRMDT